MDLQAGLVSIYVKDPDFVNRAAGVLKLARSAGLLVVHVRVAFRPNLPEVSSRNLLLGAIKASPQHQKLFEGAAGAIHQAVAPEGDEVVITKHRVSAFAGTELDLILRAHDIDTLVLFGIATSGVVLSTLLHAADGDYRLFVVKDCCADLDQDLHASLVDKLFPRQATVVSAADLLSA
jgi:nicotinamidase-related amidase